MRVPFSSLLRSLTLAAALLPFSARAQFPATVGSTTNLLENGSFDNPTEPFKGWNIDYEWTGNQFYVGNKTHVSTIVEGARKNVVKFDSAGSGGVKMESAPFLLESGFKYICNLDIKGGGCRVYFAGYKWLPGIRPHDKPALSELRLIYKSKAAEVLSEGWKSAKLELPGVVLSPQALAAFKDVRFLTVYIWFVQPGFVDNVAVTKVADPSMKF